MGFLFGPILVQPQSERNLPSKQTLFPTILIIYSGIGDNSVNDGVIRFGMYLGEKAVYFIYVYLYHVLLRMPL